METRAGTLAVPVYCPSFHTLTSGPQVDPVPRTYFYLDPAMLHSTDAEIRDTLNAVHSIAVVGWSPNPDRPSHRVARFLAQQGYRVIAVNPGQVGQMALGEVVRANLSEIAGGVDMVDIFRRSEEAGAVVDQALAAFPNLKAVWMQLGVTDTEAAKRAEARGVTAIMNRCPAIEIPRLGIAAKA